MRPSAAGYQTGAGTFRLHAHGDDIPPSHDGKRKGSPGEIKLEVPHDFPQRRLFPAPEIDGQRCAWSQEFRQSGEKVMLHHGWRQSGLVKDIDQNQVVARLAALQQKMDLFPGIGNPDPERWLFGEAKVGSRHLHQRGAGFDGIDVSLRIVLQQEAD